MLFSLAFKNIKKSIKDYGIYFFTLVIAVAVFYIFNSVDQQQSMIMASESKKDIIMNLVSIIGYVSVFVSFILGFLIIFANTFLIKRRKKEIGLYLTLGMSKRKVSTILVLETFFVGLLSLVVGLLIGVFLSQGLSVVTLKMFEVDLDTFKFVFSSAALYKTILYFGIIFGLVIVFNVISLSRYKLISLLNAKKQNEKARFRNKYVIVISFILSIILTGYAYYLLFNNSILVLGSDMGIMLLCGSVGTLLFFFSLSGFLLAVIKKIKGVYYKDLNMFNLKQINSRINTSVVSTTIISLLLLFTIVILSGSISLTRIFNNDVEENNLTDFSVNSLELYNNTNKNVFDLKPVLEDKRFDDIVGEYVLYDVYYFDEINSESLLTKESLAEIKKAYKNMVNTKTGVPLVKESSYKRLMEIFGKDYIDIKDNEYLILANVDTIVDYMKPFYENGGSIVVGGKSFVPGSLKIVDTATENSNSSSNAGVVVVSDYVLEDREVSCFSLVGNYNGADKEKKDKELKTLLYSYGADEMHLRTKVDMVSASLGLKVLMIYLGLYLGIVCAITSVTILATYELSNSSDNKERYKVLRQIGASEEMINKALFTQILITFGLPLVVALFHAFFGLREMNSVLQVLGDLNIASNLAITTGFLVVIYGGYFIATYLCSKNVIKE